MLVKLLVVSAVLAQPLLAQAPGLDSVQLGVLVRPDTVTVGQPFRVIVRVRARRGTRIEFPLGPDTVGAIQSLDTRVVTDAPDTTASEATAVYRMAAWDVGRRTVGIPEVTVRTATATRGVPLDSVFVVVRAVTPPSGKARQPRPARAVFVAPPPWWEWAIPAALAVLVLGLLWWLLKRKGHKPPARVDAGAVAKAEFDRVDALGLVEAGERGRYVALVTEVLRTYLARRIPGVAVGMTNGELLQALKTDPRVSVERLGAVLRDSDAVKFARHAVSTAQASDVGQQARRVVVETEAAMASAATPSGVTPKKTEAA